jgi:hypothetical protein
MRHSQRIILYDYVGDQNYYNEIIARFTAELVARKAKNITHRIEIPNPQRHTDPGLYENTTITHLIMEYDT